MGADEQAGLGDAASRLAGGAGEASYGLFYGEIPTLRAYVLMDMDLAALRTEGAAVVAGEELRERRDEKLRHLGAREVFPAGTALLAGPEATPRPCPVVIAVTETELVLLSSNPKAPDEEVARIPRAEVAGVRLLDEHGEPARALSEVEELDAPPQRYMLWVDRKVEGGAPTGTAFVFRSYGVAAEAERDLRRQLPA